MDQKLVVMLTDNDETVATAKADFLAAADLPVQEWGFKDVGLPLDQMVDLVKTMKAHGKRTNLEVVSLSEEEGLAGAKIAVEEINASDSAIKFELQSQDDVADGETSVNAYNKLMDWGMQLLVGPTTTGAAQAVSQ